MDILAGLSSSLGLRGGEPNAAVAGRILEDPALIDPVVAALGSREVPRVADCAEVLTKVAEVRPELVAPHADALFRLLGHKNGRVRWESAHAIGLVAALIPARIEAELPRLATLVREHDGVIVRDYALDAIAGWGSTSAEAAGRAFPILREAAGLWAGKHAARILERLLPLVKARPALAEEARELADSFLDDARAGARKAAKSLARALG